MSKPPHIVVLGAGVCGLYAARRLTKAGINVTIIEKKTGPGGLATSHSANGNYYDFGVHMLHEFDREILEDMIDIMGDERITVELNAKIRWAGELYRYPLQFLDIVKGMPTWTLIRCISGLLWTQFLNHFRKHEPKDAEEALIQLYGNALYRFFFKDFTHRYWGFPPTQLSATFIKTKMPRLSAVDYIKKMLAKFGIKDKSTKAVASALMNETLHYSRTGAETMPRRIAQRVIKEGGRIVFQATPKQLHMENNQITAVTYTDLQTQTEHTIPCDHCISTIPLSDLIRTSQTNKQDELLSASQQLTYKPVTILALLVNKPKCIDALYIYYRDRIFHRVGEPKNAGVNVNPSNHSILIVEVARDLLQMSQADIETLKQQVAADLSAEGICEADNIVETHMLNLENAYPIFKLGFEPHLEKVRHFIDSIENLQSTGRQGGFCYPNMHKAMRMGANAADNVIKQYAQHKTVTREEELVC